MNRKIKSIFYPLLPSTSPRLHAKRRKGLLYRHVGPEILECQKEQDRIFWSEFLADKKRGEFLEVGGNGLVGSHSLGLETVQGWQGACWASQTRHLELAQAVRKCRIFCSFGKLLNPEPMDLLAVHSPGEYPQLWTRLRMGSLKTQWIIVENREPDPQWCQLLEGLGYQLRFFFHDDEYYELQS